MFQIVKALALLVFYLQFNKLKYRSVAIFIIKVLYGRRLSNLQMMKLLTLTEQFQNRV